MKKNEGKKFLAKDLPKITFQKIEAELLIDFHLKKFI